MADGWAVVRRLCLVVDGATAVTVRFAKGSLRLWKTNGLIAALSLYLMILHVICE